MHDRDAAARALAAVDRRVGLDVLVILALLADMDEGEVGSRIIGLIVIGAVGSLALASVIVARRRPRVARLLGLGSAGGMLFVSWLVLTRLRGDVLSIIVWIGVMIVGAAVGWQLFRWRPDREPSGEAEDGAHIP